MRKKLFCLVLSACLIAGNIGCVKQPVEAEATQKAYKFLKGTWVTVGNSQAVKFVFTKKYVKYYNLWNADHTKVKNPKEKGNYITKEKIVSTKKKGKRWTIKIGKKGNYTYYKGSGDLLECFWKSKGKWCYSVSDSIERVDE